MKMIATQMIIIKLIQEGTAECTNKNSACAVLCSLLVPNYFQYPMQASAIKRASSLIPLSLVIT